MEIIKSALTEFPENNILIKLYTDHHSLGKMHWEGRAEDGTVFTFDLEAPLRHGQAFHTSFRKTYIVEQEPEKVLCVKYSNVKEAVHLAWKFGNLHRSIHFREASMLIRDDAANQQMLLQNDIEFTVIEEVFLPDVFYGSHRRKHHHHHHHSHSHSHGHHRRHHH